MVSKLPVSCCKRAILFILGSRHAENGLQAAAKLKAEGLNEAEGIQIEVTDQESMKAARAEIGKKMKYWMY